jgi:glycerophosphoryl diester phosphodiesterase
MLIAVSVSKLLFEFPLLLHRKGSKAARLSHEKIGHRGSRLEGLPENSLAAFRDAISCGADVIELDVWLTSCGQAVVFHDKSLARMTGSDEIDITKLAYADLPRLRDDIPMQCERNGQDEPGQRTSIPLFEDVVALIPKGVNLIIEFKHTSDELIQEVLRVVDKYGRRSQCIWFSLDEATNLKLRSLERGESRLAVITSIPGMLRVFMLYYTGLLPFLSLDCDFFGITVEEITLDVIRREKALKNLPDIVKRVLAFMFGGKPSKAMLCPALFTHLRKRGIGVLFLGVNHEDDLRTAHAAGATGVLTDRIGWLCKYVIDHGIRFKAVQ